MDSEATCTCVNCNQDISAVFCSNCGQKKFKRIDRKYITDEIKYTVFHANKGLLYSVIRILKNPGKTAKEFIDGNRVNHYKPIMLVFILSGIAMFLSMKFIGLDKIMSEVYSDSKVKADFMNSIMTFYSTYYSFLMLLAIPIISLFSKLVFRKWQHNYYEHIVLNAYGLSFFTIISILFVYPIMYFFKDDPKQIMSLSFYSMTIVPLIMVWFYKGVYSDKPLKTIILRVLLMMLMLLVLYFIVIIGVVIIMIVMNGPEAFLKMQPPK